MNSSKSSCTIVIAIISVVAILAIPKEHKCNENPECRNAEIEHFLKRNDALRNAFFDAVEKNKIAIPRSKYELALIKLGIPKPIPDKTYRASDRYLETVALLKKKGYSPSRRDFYDVRGNPIYPWDEVLACKNMTIRFEDIVSPYGSPLRARRCPYCFSNTFWIYFSSPAYRWKELMGRAGYMLICPHCVKQLEFKTTVMS